MTSRQNWVSSHIPAWMTAYGVIEAAEMIVQASFDNDNFLPGMWPEEVLVLQEEALRGDK